MRIGIGFVVLLTWCAWAAAEAPPSGKCLSIELFTRDDCQECESAATFLAELHSRYSRTRIVTWNLDHSARGVERLKAISEAFKIEKPQVPSVYLCRQFVQGFEDAEKAKQKIEDAFTIHVYWRQGCPHCAAGKKYLSALKQKYPMFQVELHEIVTDVKARKQFEDLTKQFGVKAPVVPTFHLFGQIVTGFVSDATTGKQLEELLKSGLVACQPAAEKRPAKPEQGWQVPQRNDGSRFIATFLAAFDKTGALEDSPPPFEDELELPPPTPATIPVEDNTSITVPYFGSLNAREMGMPAFTVAIGLIDGFNPCAMWVLLFLLSILVNLHDRRKIVAIAGTFVVISGLVYFAFMAAWLNVFLLIGYMRPAQIALGILAVLVGVINVKDFFAFKWGFSLSIPESAKPGIYARVRNIVTAERLWIAVSGAIVLAVVVNAVELLCSAGFPAMYTQILSLQDYSLGTYYAFLALYIAAYMFDDAIMLSIVVITLTKTKLQETGGRWLKLLAGVVILAMGLVMLFAPDWLR